MRNEFNIEILKQYIAQHNIQCSYCFSSSRSDRICNFYKMYSAYIGKQYLPAVYYSYTELAHGLQRAIADNAIPQYIIEEIIELEIASL